MNTNKAVTKLFSGNVLHTVVQFGAVVAFTRALGPGAVGSFFVFRAVLGMLGIPIDLGLSRAAEKHLSADEPQGEVIGTAVLTKAALMVPWLAGLVLAGPYVEQYIGVEGILPVLVVGVVVNQAERLSLRLLAGQFRVDQNAFLRALGSMGWLAGGLVLVETGMGATALIAAFAFGNAVTVVGALFLMDISVGWPRLSRARELLDFGRYLFVGDVGGFLYQWMDVAILRLFVPVSLVGSYEIAWRVASVSMMVTGAIRTTLFPQISRWYAADQLERIESAFYRWLQVPLYVTIPAFAGAVVLGRDVLGTVFGAEVVVAYPVLIVFMLEKILRSVQLLVGPSLFAMDKPQLGYRGSAAAIVVNLVLNVTLIPTFGLVGAAVATTLGAATAAVVNIRYVTTFVTVAVPWRRIVWAAGASVLMAAGVFLVRGLLPAGWLRVTLGVALGVALYCALLLANADIRTELRGVLRYYRNATASPSHQS